MKNQTDPRPFQTASRRHTRIAPAPGFAQLLQEYVATAGVFLPQECIGAFERYYRELLFWNAAVNLTAITAPEDIAVKHFIDSLLPLTVFDLQGSLADIGSGAGFPGIPLKIVRPGLRVSLIESSRKKANFLRHIVRTLKLANTVVLEQRAETLCDLPAFDNVIARAFSDTDTLLKMALPLLKDNGFAVVMKAKEEGAVTAVQNLKLLQKSSVTLPEQMGARTILVYQKCFT